MTSLIQEYIDLLSSYLLNVLPIDKLETAFLEKFKNETGDLSELDYDTLDELFSDFDVFTRDPILLAMKPEFYLDENKLREKIIAAVRSLS